MFTNFCVSRSTDALPALRQWFITDDNGVLCSRDLVDVQSGCCSRGQKHSCDT